MQLCKTNNDCNDNPKINFLNPTSIKKSKSKRIELIYKILYVTSVVCGMIIDKKVQPKKKIIHGTKKKFFKPKYYPKLKFFCEQYFSKSKQKKTNK